MGGQRHAPAALPPGKTRYPLYRRLGRPQGRSGRVRKISPPSGFDPRTVQRLSYPGPIFMTAWINSFFWDFVSKERYGNGGGKTGVFELGNRVPNDSKRKWM